MHSENELAANRVDVCFKIHTVGVKFGGDTSLTITHLLEAYETEIRIVD